MTKLSINLNKFALVRNARGSNIPNLINIASQCIHAGANGITVHPRPDARHITYQDVVDLSKLIARYPNVEFNVEGYPTSSFIKLIQATLPDQVTLVPDKPEQLTSDHGWQLDVNQNFLTKVLLDLKSHARVSLFVDPNAKHLEIAQHIQADSIELYTEDYATAYSAKYKVSEIIDSYAQTANVAASLDLSVNAGHDLNLRNLGHFLNNVPHIQEVSIGHALVSEAWTYGLASTIRQYLAILAR
jgi:pyridoxine 5-phosphate synthase